MFRTPTSLSSNTLIRLFQHSGTQRCRGFSLNSQLIRPSAKTPRTWQSSRTFRRGKHEKSTPREPFIEGDSPPLYDGKPSMFARWAWGLLALDMIFTASGVDLVMKHWTEPEDVSQANTSSATKVETTEATERRYVLRPLWQRLAFSVGLVVGGVAAGGLILATRDRTVWRMRISRLKLPHQQVNRIQLPRKPNAPVTEMHHAPSTYGPAILTLETASGRSKKHFLHDCELSPGRDATEMHLRVKKLRGAFVVRLPRSIILGEREKDILPSPGSGVIVVKGPPPTKINLKDVIVKGSLEDAPYWQLVELQRRIINAWIASGGNIRATTNVPDPNGPSGGWTSGPLAASRS
ncbi:hypothetical protein SCHPADRAFT_938975 [Schizopora paradoxa]|uniref:Uncharacterized protein n=1 Tax=Schizopora paradoxa TaxID=27342 RepID=A0A0H2RSW9_9AGAM|nr:hypothetical protein SCHPADRAFT_938975 [Schizopora paradoxa]